MTGHVELVDEPLEVERLGLARHVFGGDRGAPDDEQVDPGVDNDAPQRLGMRRRQGSGHRDAGGAQFAEPLGDELGADRFGVDLLHPSGRLTRRQRGDLGEQRRRVVVARPQALEVENAEPTETTQSNRRLRGAHRIHRRSEDGDVEVVGVDLPRHRHLFRVTGAARGDDGDLVEAVDPAPPLAASDLDLGHRQTLPGRHTCPVAVLGPGMPRRRDAGQGRAA